jgi:hypothetical protein
MEPQMRRVKDERLIYVRAVLARRGGDVVVVGVSVETFCVGMLEKLGRGGKEEEEERWCRQRVRRVIVYDVFRVPARSKEI